MTITIESIDYPSIITYGESFDISYAIRNTGDRQQLAFGYITDTANNQLIQGSYWEKLINPNEVHPVVYTHPSTNEPMLYKLNIGYSGGGINQILLAASLFAITFVGVYLVRGGN